VCAIDVNHVLHFLSQLHFLAVQAVLCTPVLLNALDAALHLALLKFLNVCPYKWQELLASESHSQAEAFAMEAMLFGEKTLKLSRQL